MSKQGTLAMIVVLGLAPSARAQEMTCDPDAPPVMLSTMVFVSTRHNPTGSLNEVAEIYLIDVNGKALRLTDNADRDALPALSPDGKGRIVFDSNRVRRLASPPEPNSSDLFVMRKDGSHQRFLTRGSSASWSPDGKSVAFHRSASDRFVPPVGNPSPGAPTNDSDIFVVRVHQGAPLPTNLTFEDEQDRVYINEDADWSPDGEKIAFARRSVLDNNFPSNSGDIWVMNADGSDKRQLTGLTGDIFEDKSPAWSPDSQLIAYSCRSGHADIPAQNPPEICVIKADGSDPYPTVLTQTQQGELGPHWVPSPDGNKILYQRPLPGQGQQIWIMDADGRNQTQLTFVSDGTNQFPNWGVIKVTCDEDDEDARPALSREPR